MRPLDIAEGLIGLRETPGPIHEARILEMFAACGHPEISDDETSWCAAFVGYCLLAGGFAGTGMLTARSYLKWGREVALEDAEPGDVVVISRGKSTWQGHVFFYEGQTLKGIRGLGGNQGIGQVSRDIFPKAKLLGVRRAVRRLPAPEPARPAAPPPPEKSPPAAKPAPARPVVPQTLPAALGPLLGHDSFWAGLAAAVLKPFRKYFGGRK